MSLINDVLVLGNNYIDFILFSISIYFNLLLVVEKYNKFMNLCNAICLIADWTDYLNVFYMSLTF